MKFVPALDGVRGLSVILVVIYHWFPHNHWINILPNGAIGVTMFFVLSGFLISSILMEQVGKSSFYDLYRSFVIKRSLRIFPIYYLILIVLGLLSLKSIKIPSDFYTHPLYFFGYFYNNLLETNYNWADLLSPYWSLSVEEQFYFFWPIIILNIHSEKALLYFLWFGVFFGLAVRYYSVYLNGGLGIYTFTCIDTFSWGALLAYYIKYKKTHLIDKASILILPLIILFFYIVYGESHNNKFSQIFFRTVTSMLSVALLYSVLNKDNRLKFIFSNAILRGIGKISYGIYLYHIIIPFLFFKLFSHFHLYLNDQWHIVEATLIIVVSYLSYQFIELPITSIKKRFDIDYKKEPVYPLT